MISIPAGNLLAGMPAVQYIMDKYDQRRADLQRLIDSLGRGAITRVAERIGKDPSYVSRLLYPATKDGFKRIGEETVEKLDRAFPNWQSPNQVNAEEVQGIYNVTVKPTNTGLTHIPQYDTGGAMGGGLVLRDQPGVIREWSVTDEWIIKNIRVITSKENLLIVTGFGDSMRPIFQPGDPVMVDRGVKTVDHDGIYFFRVGEEGFVKRLQRIPGEGIVAISENKAYREWTIRPDMDFEVFGRVVKAWCGQDF